ncbi:MAG TPA: hypothetical protein VMX94_11220 [Armatimonadota bacterium]|nr:hypothetical protein [Armatimonadota bacterium]
MHKLPTNPTADKSTPRRHFLWTVLLGLFSAMSGKQVFAAQEKPAQSSLSTEGQFVKTHMWKGKPPREPLDTMLLFERSDNHNDCATPHEILSLEHEEKGSKSYPWTVYSHLTTHHAEGDACVFYSRLHKNGRGWSCGMHSEVFSSAPMVGLGMNIEMTNDYAGPEQTQLIGMNIQIRGTHACQYGIQVHGDGPCEKAIGLNGKGRTGLDLAGEYGVGIHTHKNSLRLDEGASIELDGAGKVRLRFMNGRIEFLSGDKSIGHIKVDGEDHEL